ncbi:MAG: hypothetical protein WCX73_01845 [Candidatus Pacearchaeota archaeon]|jgi:hypothetical protein
MKTERKKSKDYEIEGKLITLKKIKCSWEIKKKLRKAARDWITYIKQHVSEVHKGDYSNYYHFGEINFIELFFNIQDKK